MEGSKEIAGVVIKVNGVELCEGLVIYLKEHRACKECLLNCRSNAVETRMQEPRDLSTFRQKFACLIL